MKTKKPETLLALFSEIKKHMWISSFLLILLLVSSTSWAQIPGEVCEAPIVVSSLPYSTTDNTSGYGNNYEPSDRPAIADGAIGSIPSAGYLNGNDVVYAYTPASDGAIDIEVSNHATYSGFFVFTGCPFESTVGGQSGTQANLDLKIEQLPVLAGVTYYIVISTYPGPPFTSYSLSIVEFGYDCPDLLADFGDACDDGDPNTNNDRIGEDCSCAGKAGAICETPILVTSLPYVTTDNTEYYGDNYNPVHRPAIAVDAIGNPPTASYLIGNEAVYAYTPSTDGAIDITVSNHLKYTGFFVFTGCPFESTVGGDSHSLETVDLKVEQLPVTNGITYYIVISTWPGTQTTPYTLTIEGFGYECPDLGVDFGTPCDDGDPNTHNDQIREDCTCAGFSGVICDAPIEVSSLPYVTTDNTSFYGDNYGPDDVPPFTPGVIGYVSPSYLKGNDVVYAYTPTEYGAIKISVTNHEARTGFYVFTGCPFEITVGGDTSPSAFTDLVEDQLMVDSGLTYYIVISTDSPQQTTSYTLSITEAILDCPVLIANIGDACDDGNPQTEYDEITADCECAGTIFYDCAWLGANIGDACDDGDPDTENTVVNSNCECAIPGPANDACENAIVISCGNSITGTTINAIEETDSGFALGGTMCAEGPAKDVFYSLVTTPGYFYTVTVLGADYDGVLAVYHGPCDDLFEMKCSDTAGMGEPESMIFLAYGYENLTVRTFGAGTTQGSYTLSVTCGVLVDCPNLNAYVGDICDDEDPNTENDVITEDCECVGTIFYDCPSLGANIGDSCDDGDASTEDDVITTDCGCAGTIIYDCPAFEANIGDSCDDENPDTENDVVTADCGCAGIIIYDCPALSANIGDSCDDGDASTENDEITEDCGCSGTIIYDCPTLSANIGDSCDDENPNTENDVITEDCGCAGTMVYDCPALEANFGDNCNDGNPDTEDDVVAEDCECAGIPTFKGMICEAPIEISSLPYLTTDNTELYGDNYNSTDRPPFTDDAIGSLSSSYLNGNEVVYAFTPFNNTAVDISVTEHGAKAGVFVFTGCPFESTVGSYGTFSADTELTIEKLPVSAGVTYYIVISNLANQTTPYTLSIKEVDCYNLLAYIGDACDDQDADTFNDVVTEDCECVGEPPAVGSVCETAIPVSCNAEPVMYPSYTSNSTNITTCSMGNRGLWFTFMGTGADITINSVANFNHVMSINYGSCESFMNLTCVDDNDAPGSPESFTIESSVAGEKYYVYIAHYYHGTVGKITIDIDCDDPVAVDCPVLKANIGDSCNDGNPETGNDIITEDCECAGTIVYDCLALSANIGDSCDDGNPNTENDVITTDCGCSGTIIYDCPTLSANIGDACDDLNIETDNDVITADCECEGGINYECPLLEANIGAPCDDEDPTTENDEVNIDCECVGTPIIVFDCPALEANFSDDCDDGDASTKNDIITEDCHCVGSSIYDCPILSANVGDSCDDGDASTENDVLNDDCECSGTIVYDCTELEANFGDTCDDGDASTENDVIAEDCECAGTIIYDCPGLSANIGDSCDDGNPDTENDLLVTDCECVGTPVEPADCQDFVYYLADFTPGIGTNIYEVTLSGNNATLDFIANSIDEVSLAYNNADNLIYAVSKMNSQYRTLNPHSATPILSAPVSLGGFYAQFTGATFAANGDLLIGDQNGNKIYAVNVATTAVSIYDNNAPLLGGDLASVSSGILYASTNYSGGGLFEINPTYVSPDLLIANIPASTGLTATASGQLLLTVRNQTGLALYNTDGTSAGSYSLTLHGQAFKLNYGDLASGCNTYQDPIMGDCEDLRTYYAHFDPIANQTEIYGIDFSGSLANLTLAISFPGNRSIAIDGASGEAYAINKTETFANGITLNGITAAAFNPNDGMVYLGDSWTNAIYTYDVSTNAVEFYADGFVNGGDLAITSDGSIYLATQTGNSLYEVNNSGGSDFICGIPSMVTGAARSNTDMGILLSNKGSNVFTEIDAATGNVINAYPAMLNGAPFLLEFGDMASACYDNTIPQSLIMKPVGITSVNGTCELTSLPNPTTGHSQVVFTTAVTSRALVEVYDMNGRNVATLFDQEAQHGEEYRLHFNGSELPNGVYIYRLTTQNETIIDKFMIAR